MNRVFLAGYYRTPYVNMVLSREDQRRAVSRCVLETMTELRLGMTDKVDRVYSLGPSRLSRGFFGLSGSVPIESCVDRRAFGLNFIKAGIEQIQDSEANLILYVGSSREKQKAHQYDFHRNLSRDRIARAIQANHSSIFLNRMILVNSGDSVVAHDQIWDGKSGIKVFAAASFALVSEKAVKEMEIKPIAELYNVSLDPDSSMEEALSSSLRKVHPALPVGALRAIEMEDWYGQDLAKKMKIAGEYINPAGSDLSFGNPGQRVADYMRLGKIIEILRAGRNDYGAVISLGDTNANDEILRAACLTLRRIHFWNEDSKAAL